MTLIIGTPVDSATVLKIGRDTESYRYCTQCGHTAKGESGIDGNCPECGDCAPIRHRATKVWWIQEVGGV